MNLRKQEISERQKSSRKSIVSKCSKSPDGKHKFYNGMGIGKRCIYCGIKETKE